MYKPAATTTILDGRQTYETHDILEQHPSNPELWRIVGRADDQIMLSNGEKVCDVKIHVIAIPMFTVSSRRIQDLSRISCFKINVLLMPSCSVAPGPIMEFF